MTPNLKTRPVDFFVSIISVQTVVSRLNNLVFLLITTRERSNRSKSAEAKGKSITKPIRRHNSLEIGSLNSMIKLLLGFTVITHFWYRLHLFVLVGKCCSTRDRDKLHVCFICTYTGCSQLLILLSELI